jgi:translocator protein
MNMGIITNNQEHSMNDRARQALVATALVATLATNGLANTLPLNGQTTGEISDRFPIPITPAGYVFSIWGLIYLGLIGYIGYQATPGQKTNQRLRRIGPWFILSCIANISWILLWHYNHYKFTLIAMLGLLWSLIMIVRQLDRDLVAWNELIDNGQQPSTAEFALVDLPFRVYLGWISVATIVNTTVVLYDAGWKGFGIDPQVWTTLLLGVGAALAAGQAWLRRDAAFPLVVAWAFAGVALKQPPGALAIPAGWTAAAASAAAAGTTVFRKN